MLETLEEQPEDVCEGEFMYGKEESNCEERMTMLQRKWKTSE